MVPTGLPAHFPKLPESGEPLGRRGRGVIRWKVVLRRPAEVAVADRQGQAHTGHPGEVEVQPGRPTDEHEYRNQPEFDDGRDDVAGELHGPSSRRQQRVVQSGRHREQDDPDAEQRGDEHIRADRAQRVGQERSEPGPRQREHTGGDPDNGDGCPHQPETVRFPLERRELGHQQRTEAEHPDRTEDRHRRDGRRTHPDGVDGVGARGQGPEHRPEDGRHDLRSHHGHRDGQQLCETRGRPTALGLLRRWVAGSHRHRHRHRLRRGCHGAVHGGAVHGRTVRNGAVHGRTVRGGAVHGGAVHGGVAAAVPSAVPIVTVGSPGRTRMLAVG